MTNANAMLDVVERIEQKTVARLQRVDETQAEFAQRLVAIEQRGRGDEISKSEAKTLRAQTYNADRWIDVKTGEPIRVLTREQKMADLVDRNDRTAALVRDGLTFGQYARAIAAGPKSELERKALAEGTPAAGGYMVPTPLANGFFDLARSAAVVMQAGARTVPMDSQTLKIAKLTADPTAQWLAENAASTPSDPTFGAVTLTAKTLRAVVIASRELVNDAPNFGQQFETSMRQSFASQMDRAALVGSGTGAEPLGIFGSAGISIVTLGTNGATLTNYDPLVDSIVALQTANAQPATAFIYAPRTNGTLGKLKDTTNQPLVAPKLVSDVPHLVTSSIPINQTQGTSTDCSTILSGDFADCLIGLRQDFILEVHPGTNLNNYQFTFLVHARMDMQLARAGSFCKVVGIRP